MQPSLSKITDYPKFLNDHWTLHLAPRAKDAPTVISTFAGCGGSSLGYSFAGFKELLAVEWDQNAVDTFKLNFPDVPMYHGDIAELSVEQCLEMTGLKVGDLDVFDGSPPCQGFSTAGKRVMQDVRNFLFREYCRLLKGLQPKVFVMENVSGMVKGKMKLIFADILRELKACGYKVKAVLMNAMYFGVPQSRQRMIFVGVRDDREREPTHPLAKFLPVTSGDALWQISIDQSERELLIEAGQKYVAYQEWPLIPVGGKKTDVKKEGGGFSCTKYDPAKPARTVQKNDGNLTMHGALHWSEWRRFTTREFARFGSFPDDFQFISTSKAWGEGVNRIGNSVPPLMMKAIAEHIRTEIL